MGRRVTGLQVQQRNPQRVNVYLDGVYAFGLARIVAAWLRVGEDLSEERIALLQAEDSLEAAFQKALRFIEARPRSLAEVRQRLQKTGLDDQAVAGLLERLQSSGLLDDRRFAEGWVENRVSFHPRSQRAMAYELRRLGVGDEDIRAAVAETDDSALALQAGRRYARRLSALEWPEFRQKLLSALARRGFGYAAAQEAATLLWQEHHPEGHSTDDDIFAEIEVEP